MHTLTQKMAPKTPVSDHRVWRASPPRQESRVVAGELREGAWEPSQPHQLPHSVVHTPLSLIQKSIFPGIPFHPALVVACIH